MLAIPGRSERARLTVQVWMQSDQRWLGFLFCVIVMVLVWAAWMGDDAFITMRVVDNAVNGYGLRWNVGERVQAFTHPLWLFLLLPAYAIWPDPYWVPILLSLVLSALAVWFVLFRLADRSTALLFGLLLVTSRAFVEFSTSGLETPLSYFLVVLLVGQLRRVSAKDGNATGLVWLSALLVLNRADLLVLVLPVLISAGRARSWGRYAWLAPCSVMAWFAFATLYFGHPLPNSVIAKTNLGLPRNELIANGLAYLGDSFLRDPISLATIITVTLLCGLRSHWAWARPLMVGCWLYLAAIVWAGGDFMSGRFVALPFVLAIAVGAASWRPARDKLPVWVLVAAMLGAVLASLARLPIPLTQPPAPSAITNERDFYAVDTGLPLVLSTLVRGAGYPWMHSSNHRPYDPYREALRLRSVGDALGRIAVVRRRIGILAIYAGPRVHVIDELALTDPFLSRLPASCRPCRPGHYERALPPGFAHAVAGNPGAIADPDLQQLWQDVQMIAVAPLLTPGRWDAIVRRIRPRYL